MATTKQKPSAQKLDPNATFPAVSFSRRDIADTINDVMSGTGDDFEPLTPDDPRLTDEVCRQFAENMNDAHCIDEIQDEEYQWAGSFVGAYRQRLFGK